MTMPKSRAFCWYSLGTRNDFMMRMKTKRLSTDNDHSIAHPV